MTSPPLAFLGDILNAILDLPFLIVDGLVEIFNAFIAAIAALAQAFLSLLPAFPEAPDPPDGVLGFLTWIVPLGPIVACFAVMTTLWIGFLGLKVVLRWVKAL